MTHIIPDKDLEKYIQATGWVLGQEVIVRKPVNNPTKPQPFSQSLISIDDILKGKSFHDADMPTALQQALDFAGPSGYVATMPELIAAKVKADKSHNFWQNWHTVHTEENIGIDSKGRFYTANEPVLILVNGGGILTPTRIKQAYEKGLISGSAKYKPEEFDNLLDGKLPDGTSIELYNFEDIKKGVSNLPHKFGVVMPYSMAQNTESGYHQKEEFMANPLVIARAGGVENLESYYEKAKHSDGDLGCYHPFDGRDASVSQGRVLFLDYGYYGLYGRGDLDDIGGWFVGVVAEPPSARK